MQGQKQTHGTCSCVRCAYRRVLAGGVHTPVLAIVELEPAREEHAIQLWKGHEKTTHSWTFPNVDDARDAIPAGLKRLERDRRRRPEIVEVWL